MEQIAGGFPPAPPAAAAPAHGRLPFARSLGQSCLWLDCRRCHLCCQWQMSGRLLMRWQRLLLTGLCASPTGCCAAATAGDVLKVQPYQTRLWGQLASPHYPACSTAPSPPFCSCSRSWCWWWHNRSGPACCSYTCGSPVRFAAAAGSDCGRDCDTSPYVHILRLGIALLLLLLAMHCH